MRKLYFNLIVSFFTPIFAFAILQVGIAWAQDTVSPYLVSVSSDGATFTTAGTETITINFSENVKKKNACVLVDGDSQTLDGVGPSNTFTFDFTVADREFDVKVISFMGFRDEAGNLMAHDSSHTFMVDTASDGDLDKTFAPPDIVKHYYITFSTDRGGIDAVLQPDGKIVGVGAIKTATDDQDTAVFRFNTDGSLDTSFGSGGTDGDGIASFDASIIGGVTGGPYPEGASAVALQSDGKIVVGGDGYDTGGFFDMVISRFDANGNMDTSFGTDGKSQIDFTTGKSDRVWDLAVDTGGTGNIVAVGHADSATGGDFAIVLLDSDGAAVSGFDGDGKLTVDFSGGPDVAYAGEFDSNGDIIVAGSAYDSSDFYFALAKMDQTGSLDTDFGTAGKLKTSILGEIRDTKIVGTDIYVFGKSEGKFTFAKFDEDGDLDTAFGSSGITQTANTGEPSKIEIDADGKIWGAGVLGGGQFFAVRLNADGSIDTDFGTDVGGNNPGGKVTIEETDADATIHPLGFVVKSGTTPDAVFVGRKDDYGYSLAGLKNSGVIDTSISQIGIGNGKLIIPGFKIQSVVQKSNGKIVAAGYQQFEDNYSPPNILEQRIALLQLNADGTGDCDFGDSVLAFKDIHTVDDRKYGSACFEYCGIKILDLPDYVEIYSVSIDELNDKIVVAGRYGHVDQHSLVARFNANGSIDTTFSNGDADGISGVKILDTSVTNNNNYFRDVKALSDGSILAAGVACNTLGGSHFAFYYWTLAKFDSSGDLDTTFGQTDFDGSNTPGVTFDGIDGVSSLVVDIKNNGSDNGPDLPFKILVNAAETKITLAGWGLDSDGYWMAARFDSNGTLDQTFGAGDGDGTDGVAIFQPSAGYAGYIEDLGYDAVLQPDGKIVMSGVANPAGGNGKLAVARLNANGIVDANFGTNGITITSFAGADPSVDIQPDGKIVMADAYFQIVRFNANGSLDTSFGTDGIVDHGTNLLKDVLVLPDGNILVVGQNAGIVARLANTVSSLPVALPGVYLLLLD